MERIRVRDRKGEKNMDREFIDNLNNLYTNFIDTYSYYYNKDVQFIIITTDNLRTEQVYD